ncbi:MAG: hypothetical protein OXU23_03685 [Candidatus Poribacteria bacterium]|nr:hypothetical protein [Candidatus Poribacteria bacterium]
MNGLKYKRNWAFEQMATVFYLDGTERQCHSQTNNKGQIEWIKVDGTYYTPDQFGSLGITDMHFMTPASLSVDVPYDVMGKVYLELGKTISQGNTNKKMDIRASIADKLHRAKINIHDLLAALSTE